MHADGPAAGAATTGAAGSPAAPLAVGAPLALELPRDVAHYASDRLFAAGHTD